MNRKREPGPDDPCECDTRYHVLGRIKWSPWQQVAQVKCIKCGKTWSQAMKTATMKRTFEVERTDPDV